jgi:putative PIN family toxin of toxin-antitoxin system
VIRAVIDTNVLVSALLLPSGNEALVLLAIQQDLVRPCLSEAIMVEYTGVLLRPKFPFDAEDIHAMLAAARIRG